MRITLDVVSNMTMTVASVFLIVVVGMQWHSPAAGTLNRQVTSPSYNEGQAFPQIPGLTTTRDKPTLLLFVKSTCKYCTESLPFYARIIQGQRAGWAVEIAAVTQEPAEQCRAYLVSGGLAIDKVLTVAGTDVRLRGTPTLVLLSPKGTVIKIWEGKLSPDREEEVVRLLARS